MLGINTKIKRRSRLKWAKKIRLIRDMMLRCQESESDQSAIRWIREYLPYQNNSISYGGTMLSYWARVVTEYKTFRGYGDTETQAIVNAGLKIYNRRRDYFLSKSANH